MFGNRALYLTGTLFILHTRSGAMLCTAMEDSYLIYQFPITHSHQISYLYKEGLWTLSKIAQSLPGTATVGKKDIYVNIGIRAFTPYFKTG